MKAWKVQKFFGDVVYDLRSRGLLPVVGLLLVAMIAVPVLISRHSSTSSTPSLQQTAGAVSTPETENAVVSYNPGIRDYKRRLNDLSPKDPFRQQFAQPAASAAQQSALTTSAPTGGGSATSSGSTSSLGTGSDTTVSGGSGDTSGGSGDTSGGGKRKQKNATVTYKVNVLAGEVNSTLTPFNDVAAMTPLPSQTAPVVLYYGLTGDNKQAQFLVSNKVSTVTGPGVCVPSPDDCALLTLGPGASEDLVYTGDGKTYRIVVAAIKTIKK
jgi:hypothetical protein